MAYCPLTKAHLGALALQASGQVLFATDLIAQSLRQEAQRSTSAASEEERAASHASGERRRRRELELLRLRSEALAPPALAPPTSIHMHIHIHLHIHADIFIYIYMRLRSEALAPPTAMSTGLEGWVLRSPRRHRASPHERLRHAPSHCTLARNRC